MADLVSSTFDYISGNVDDKTRRKIENNEDIMLAIILSRKDYKYYERASKRLKKSFSFVSRLLDVFPPEQVDRIVTYYFKHSKGDDLHQFEMLCLVDELYDRTKSPCLEHHVDVADTFYMYSGEDINEIVRENYEEVLESRDEFNIVNESYSHSEIIRRFFARRRLDELFLHLTNSYEEFIHANFRTKAELEAKGFNNFLIEVLYGVDVALADYASANISLLDRYSDLNGLVLENWDNYLDTLNREKIKDVEVDVITYMGNNHLPDYYFGFLPYIISRTPHEAIFRRYGDIDLSYMREPKEFAERRFCETFISRITKRFNKDTLFGEEDYDNSEKCEIIDIAKVRDNK